MVVGRALAAAGLSAILVGLLAGPGPAQQHTFPGTNGLIVFGFGSALVTVNPDGSNRRTLLDRGNGIAATEPAWSPDGTRVAFANKNNPLGIKIVNADGTGLTSVTTAATDDDPTWSPDGRKLAFASVVNGRHRLVTANLDGSGRNVLTPSLEREVVDPEWSPDGSRIAFSDTTDVYVVNADGSNLRDLNLSVPGKAFAPTWSPDGSKLAYAYLSTIVVSSPDGSSPTTIAQNLGEIWELSWSPDGTKIAIAADLRGPLQEELVFINADGSNLTRPGVDLDTTVDWGTAQPVAAVPPPVAGVNVNLSPVSGTVRVRVRGTDRFADLASLSSIPVGSEIDVTKGRVRLVSAAGGTTTQTADFYAGRAVIAQTRAKAPVTTMRLSGPLACPKRKAAGAAAPKKMRRLWGNGSGRFRTQGRYAAATVRGTIWLTEDRCTSTLVRVRQGRVAVLDRVRHRTVIVVAGRSYVARARR